MTHFSSIGPRFGSLEISMTPHSSLCYVRLINDDDATIKATTDGDRFEVVGHSDLITNFAPDRDTEKSNIRFALGSINYPGKGWNTILSYKKALREMLEQYRNHISDQLIHPRTIVNDVPRNGKPSRLYQINTL